MQIMFRTDASLGMGSGHVMRCIALAEAFHDLGHHCHFASHSMLPALEPRLAAEGIDLHRIGADPNAERTCHKAWDLDAAVIIVDGYHFTDAWRRNLYQFAQGSRRSMLVFQDYPMALPRDADFVLNVAGEMLAEDTVAPVLLYGADYLLLRREIRVAARRIAAMEERPGILVTFGGTDPAGLTLPVTRALVERLGPDAPLDIVIGAGFADPAKLSAELTRLGPGIRLRHDPKDIGRLMALSGLALSAGGGTVGELAALQVPAILAIVADNQIEGTRRAAAGGWCRALDSRLPEGSPGALAEMVASLWNDLPQRRAMMAKTKGLVPLDGAERVARAVLASIPADRTA